MLMYNKVDNTLDLVLSLPNTDRYISIKQVHYFSVFENRSDSAMICDHCQKIPPSEVKSIWLRYTASGI